jgi:uncharacterized protein
MKTRTLAALCALFAGAGFAQAAPLSPAMLSLCDKAHTYPFLGSERPPVGPEVDPLLLTIARTDDVPTLRKALSGQDLHAPRGRFGGAPLLAAVGAANWQAVSLMLDMGGDLQYTFYGETLFERALLVGHPEIACQLVARGAPVPPPSPQSAHLVALAALTADTDDALTIVTFLLERGYPVDATAPPDDVSALRVAVEMSNPRLVSALIRRQANPLLADKHGETPLSAAHRKGDRALIAALHKALACAASSTCAP